MNLLQSLEYQPQQLAFGTSGLRGLVTDMTDLECYINVAGFLRFLRTRDGLVDNEIVYLAGDLRDSTPRILAVMAAAFRDNNVQVIYGGKVPTPAIAYYALHHNSPCVMVTGSHIPADRNGIKFYKRGGEVLKADELAIHESVDAVRQEIYERSIEASPFDNRGNLKELPGLPDIDPDVAATYAHRYGDAFGSEALQGKQVIFYQHSAVGRDLLVEVLTALGANVVPVKRSDVFVPIDSENVGPAERATFKEMSAQYPDNFAIVSTDGDSDRPFVVDETGTFHRGDVLGCVVTEYLGAKFVAIPISGNDAVDVFCRQHGITKVNTKIGSPYVVSAMEAADRSLQPIVGWEVNGGFLLGTDTKINDVAFKALPTRDAALPIIASLVAASDKGIKLSELFAALPPRYTGGALIDNVPPAQIERFRSIATDQVKMQQLAEITFASSTLGEVQKLDLTDGLRLVFTTGDVIHLRPSGNAPQFRVYSNADSQAQADTLAADAVAPNGYIEQLLNALERL